MLRCLKFSMLMMVWVVLLSSSVQAKNDENDKNDLTQDEYRVRHNQLVITDAAPMCDVKELRIRGVDLGGQPPHVTLALMPLTVLEGPVSVAGDVQ